MAYHRVGLFQCHIFPPVPAILSSFAPVYCHWIFTLFVVWARLLFALYKFFLRTIKFFIHTIKFFCLHDQVFVCAIKFLFV